MHRLYLRSCYLMLNRLYLRSCYLMLNRLYLRSCYDFLFNILSVIRLRWQLSNVYFTHGYFFCCHWNLSNANGTICWFRLKSSLYFFLLKLRFLRFVEECWFLRWFRFWHCVRHFKHSDSLCFKSNSWEPVHILNYLSRIRCTVNCLPAFHDLLDLIHISLTITSKGQLLYAHLWYAILLIVIRVCILEQIHCKIIDTNSSDFSWASFFKIVNEIKSIS